MRLSVRLKDYALRMLEKAGWYRLPAGVAIGDGGSFRGYSNLGSVAKQIGTYQNMVATCANRRGLDLAQLPLRLYNKKGRDREAWQEIHEHPLLDLWERPNPIMTGYQMRLMMSIHRDLTGMAFGLIIENRIGRPAEIIPLPPQSLVRIETSRDSDQIITGFRFRGDAGQEQVFSPEQIWYRRFPSPMNLVYGASIVQQQAFIYDIDLAQRVYQRSFMQNSARPDVVLSTDQSLTEPEAKRMKRRWKASHQGPEKAGEPVVMDKGLTAKTLSMNMRDMEFISQAQWSQDQLLAAFGVPAGKLGIVKDVNRANALGIDHTYRSETIGPLAKMDSDDITIGLAQRYDLRLVAEIENYVPQDDEFEHKKEMERLDRGVLTINEWRESKGRQPLTGGDIATRPATMIPIDRSAPKGDQGGADNLRLRKSLTWEEFAARVESWALSMKSALADVFHRQRAEVLKRVADEWPKQEARYQGWSRNKIAQDLKAGGWLEVVFQGWKEWAGVFSAECWGPYMEAVVSEAGNEALTFAGVAVDFNSADPRVVQWLKGNAATAAKVNEHTRRSLRRHLVQAIEKGEKLDQAIDRVNSVFDWCEGKRSETIARTEIANARRYGYHEGLVQSGLEFTKSWQAEPGARPTHSKAALDYGSHNPIALKAAFRLASGATCQIPGHTGNPNEDINCRCSVEYQIDPNAKAAGPPPAPERSVRRYARED